MHVLTKSTPLQKREIILKFAYHLQRFQFKNFQFQYLDLYLLSNNFILQLSIEFYISCKNVEFFC